MMTIESILAANDGNKVKAAVDLVPLLMRGDAPTFKLGYSIGNALIAAVGHYNLTAREVAMAVEELPTAIRVHDSPTLRPLVVVHVGGGMVQWTHEWPGIGLPTTIVLDFDREGQGTEELRGFLAEIDAALDEIARHGEPRDEEERDIRYTLGLARNEYQDHIDEGTSPSRYR